MRIATSRYITHLKAPYVLLGIYRRVKYIAHLNATPGNTIRIPNNLALCGPVCTNRSHPQAHPNQGEILIIIPIGINALWGVQHSVGCPYRITQPYRIWTNPTVTNLIGLGYPDGLTRPIPQQDWAFLSGWIGPSPIGLIGAAVRIHTAAHAAESYRKARSYWITLGPWSRIPDRWFRVVHTPMRSKFARTTVILQPQLPLHMEAAIFPMQQRRISPSTPHGKKKKSTQLKIQVGM